MKVTLHTDSPGNFVPVCSLDPSISPENHVPCLYTALTAPHHGPLSYGEACKCQLMRVWGPLNPLSYLHTLSGVCASVLSCRFTSADVKIRTLTVRRNSHLPHKLSKHHWAPLPFVWLTYSRMPSICGRQSKTFK